MKEFYKLTGKYKKIKIASNLVKGIDCGADGIIRDQAQIDNLIAENLR